MMNKWLYSLLAIVFLLLSACADDKEIEEAVDSVVEVEEEVEEDSLLREEETQSPQYALDTNWSLKPIAGADAQVVLLTIDDAPDKRALNMAKTLKELNAPAIFFVNGHFINTDEKKAVLKEIYEMGFAIGNHTKTHADLHKLSEEEQREEILSVSNVVEEVTGERPQFFRAPFGHNTDYSSALVEEEGMLLMNWSFGYDWEKQYMDKDAIKDIMVNTELLSNGSNLLMHDRPWTADALRGIVEGLRAKGYGFIDPAMIQGVTHNTNEKE